MAEATAAQPSVETLISRLEEITRTMETPETGLEGSIALYEEGLSIAEQCRKRLQEARKKIEVINSGMHKEKPAADRAQDLFTPGS
ncbi:exodeoxyribonuclease VII small subunit [Chlorobium phaeovibrioides]|uniref:exodeoxyribonuclease VII small subunit n=1 Tax=Chlorobium phaeovibrioides TaxID=1094 RepID=UPI000F832F73|nr:exodeoxyribonuclease VII small subunit [Chlorobium phaeovibrioides]RTY36196.1 exodeoxyribonuclease VII small subunit [Chlorobium phaeovibrioides]